MTFSEHLDLLLNEPEPPSVTVLPDDAHFDWFVASHSLPPVRGVPVAPRPQPVPQPQQNTATNSPSPVTLLWSERQEEAIDCLNRLGARLPVDPTLADVRHAWRQLARALHPDAAGPQADARQFSDAASAWQVLQSGPCVEVGDGSFRAGL